MGRGWVLPGSGLPYEGPVSEATALSLWPERWSLWALEKPTWDSDILEPLNQVKTTAATIFLV